jgi:hypothetical protein
VAWDLRFPDPTALGAEREDDEEEAGGFLAAPGAYAVTLVRIADGETETLAGPVSFEVERMRTGALEGSPPEETAAFWQRLAAAQRSATAAGKAIALAFERMKGLQVALGRSRAAPDGLDREIHAIEQELHSLDQTLSGSRARQDIGETDVHTIERRLRVVADGTRLSTYGPTPTHRRSLEIAEEELTALRESLNTLLEQRLPALEAELREAGAPWAPGQPVPPVE